MITLLVAILLAVMAVVLFILAGRIRKNTGIPSGKVIYVDTSQFGRVEKPLFDPLLRLTGKPDYLIRQGNQAIPIEVKSRRSPKAPHDSHIFQLAAYCILVERSFGSRPPYGILHYVDKSFAIDFTPELEQSVRATIHEMQTRANDEQVDRSHQDQRRCQHCGYRSACDQSLRI
jgi:CRISPR-associated exonuclease Cas4